MTVRTNEIKKAVEKRLSLSIPTVSKVFDLIFEVIAEELKAGNSVGIYNFGRFEIFLRHARVGVNPLPPHDKIKVPEVRIAKFRTSRKLKKLIKK